MKSRFLLMLSLLALAGCATTPVAKRTVGLPAEFSVALPAADLDVRLAEDLRTSANPLRFRADGTVVPCRSLVYYAPMEAALARALRDAARPAGEGVLRLTVLDFCADERGETPVARVTLAAGKRRASAVRPLPEGWGAPDLRTALAQALQEAFAALFQEQ